MGWVASCRCTPLQGSATQDAHQPERREQQQKQLELWAWSKTACTKARKVGHAGASNRRGKKRQGSSSESEASISPRAASVEGPEDRGHRALHAHHFVRLVPEGLGVRSVDGRGAGEAAAREEDGQHLALDELELAQVDCAEAVLEALGEPVEEDALLREQRVEGRRLRGVE